MSQFSVNTAGLKSEADVWKSIISSLDSKSNSLDAIIQAFSLSGSAGSSIKKSLKMVSEELENIIKSTETFQRALSDIASDYEKTEKTIKKTRISDGVGGSNPSSYSAVAGGSTTYTKDGVTYHAEGAVLTAEGDAGIDKYGAHAEGSVAVAKGEASVSGKYGGASVEASFIEGKGEANFGLPDSFTMNDEESKTAGISASASVAVASAAAEGYLGSEKNNVHGKAEGSVLGADANAEIGVVAGEGNIGVRASVGAEAYLAKGEVSGGFSIFGIDIDVGVEGMVGVEAEASAEVGIAGFGFDLGLGPVGLDITVDWSDIDLIFWD